MISKTLSTSEKRAALHPLLPDLAEFCQQLYPLLVAHSDDFGRLQGDVFTVKHAIDPSSPRLLPDFTRALQGLHDVGLIVWYEVSGRRYIQIVQFDPHQPGLHKRTKSAFPGAPGNFPAVPSEGKGTEQKRTEQKISPTPLLGAVPAILKFPVVGAKGPTWDLTEVHVAEWVVLYPNLDILAECRRALAWTLANPGRRKTAGGMPKFLVNWLNRAVQDGGARHTPRPGTLPTYVDWTCPHVDPCGNRAMCEHKNNLPAKYPHRAAAAV